MGTPESFVEPIDIYERCRALGMDFVTITDHNSIHGALEIAHLPGAFVSSEVTTYFPENGCKVHCLVYGISEEDFDEIQRARNSIYDFSALCLERDIICSVAHPLFQVNQRLGVDLLEKLILLFKRFESINATSPARTLAVTDSVLTGLTPERIAEMAGRHGIEPVGPEPWRKFVTGGSDDHSGVYLGRGSTATPHAESVEEFLGFLREGEHTAHGSAGTALQFAHSLYHIAYGYYRNRIEVAARARNRFVGKVFDRLLNPPQSAKRSLGARVKAFVERMALGVVRRRLNETERALVDEFQRLFEDREMPFTASEQSDQRAFRTACKLSQQFAYLFLKKCLEHGSRGEVIECVQTISSLGPVALGIAPYLAAFNNLRKDRGLVRDVAEEFGCPDLLTNGRKTAWLIDGSISAEEIQRLYPRVCAEGQQLTILTCAPSVPRLDVPVWNFEPVGEFHVPGHQERVIYFPPFLEVMSFIDTEECSRLVVSTPGPLGLTGLGAARLLGIDAVGILDTDFARRVGEITDDHIMADAAHRFTTWFFGQMDSIVAAHDKLPGEAPGAHCESQHADIFAQVLQSTS
jgi:hypothetical protein